MLRAIFQIAIMSCFETLLLAETRILKLEFKRFVSCEYIRN